MYKSLVQCTGTAEADGKGVELPDMRQEKRSPNHWNPKLDKELQRSDQFSKIPGRGRKLILTTFPFSLWLVSLVGSICLPQQSPQISPPFFQLPTSLLSWAECLHRHRQAALAFPPQAHLLSSGRGVLTIQSQSPGWTWAPGSPGRSSIQHSQAPSHLNLHRLKVLSSFLKNVFS